MNSQKGNTHTVEQVTAMARKAENAYERAVMAGATHEQAWHEALQAALARPASSGECKECDGIGFTYADDGENTVPCMPCGGSGLRKSEPASGEAVKLAAILDGMTEGSYNLESLYEDDQPDGDPFVARAADLLREFATTHPAEPVEETLRRILERGKHRTDGDLAKLLDRVEHMTRGDQDCIGAQRMLLDEFKERAAAPVKVPDGCVETMLCAATLLEQSGSLIPTREGRALRGYAEKLAAAGGDSNHA